MVSQGHINFFSQGQTQLYNGKICLFLIKLPRIQQFATQYVELKIQTVLRVGLLSSMVR